MVVVHISVPISLLQELDAQTRQLGISRAEAFRQAVMARLKQTPSKKKS